MWQKGHFPKVNACPIDIKCQHTTVAPIALIKIH